MPKYQCESLLQRGTPKNVVNRNREGQMILSSHPLIIMVIGHPKIAPHSIQMPATNFKDNLTIEGTASIKVVRPDKMVHKQSIYSQDDGS